jgi:hypothetical protein
VLLASYGLGASRQERYPVLTDATWSSGLQLRASGRDSFAARVIPQVHGSCMCGHKMCRPCRKMRLPVIS